MDGYVLGYSIAGVVWMYQPQPRGPRGGGGYFLATWSCHASWPRLRVRVRPCVVCAVLWCGGWFLIMVPLIWIRHRSRMGLPGEQVAYGLIVASYRRRMGVIAVREMARHRYRQSQFAGLTRLQLDEIGRERQVQWQGRQRAGGRRWRRGRWSSRRRWFPWRVRSRMVWLSECGCDAGRCRLLIGIVLRSGGVCVRVNVRFVWGAFVGCCFECGRVLELVVCRVRFARVSCLWLRF